MKKIVFFFLILFSFIIPVYAGNSSISSTTGTIFVNNTITITVNVNNLAGKFKIVSSNNSILSGGDSGIWLENQTKTFKFTAKGTGSATISLIPIDVADLSNNQKYTTTKSLTVNVINPSKNNYLSSITIDGYDLNPQFNKETLEYNLEVENDVRQINIAATKEDSTASIKGIGEISLEEGSNTIPITVTAQNGTVKTYTINVLVKDLAPIEVKINDINYTVVRKKDLLPTASSIFEETIVNIDGNDVPGYKNEKSKTTLVGLSHAGESDLYIYDNGKYKLYEEYSFNQIYLQILDMPNNNYSITKINVNNKSVVAYNINGYPYPIIYGMNMETGETNYYSYDAKENTLQIFKEVSIETKEDLYFKIIVILFGVIVVSYIIL